MRFNVALNCGLGAVHKRRPLKIAKNWPPLSEKCPHWLNPLPTHHRFWKTRSFIFLSKSVDVRVWRSPCVDVRVWRSPCVDVRVWRSPSRLVRKISALHNPPNRGRLLWTVPQLNRCRCIRPL